MNLIIRKLHRTVGIIFVPFFLLTAVIGSLLLFRNTQILSNRTFVILIGIHNWEIVAHYVGVILAVAIIFMSISGIILFVQFMRLQSRHKVAKVVK